MITIKRVFFLVDIMLILMQISIEGILIYEANIASSHDEIVHIVFERLLFPSLLEIVFSLLLVVSACYITSWLRKSTGKKQNNCLLMWHIINLFILTIVIALVAILYQTAHSFNENDKDYWKFKYYDDAWFLVK